MEIVTSMLYSAIMLMVVLFSISQRAVKERCTRVFMWLCIGCIITCLAEATTYVHRPLWMPEMMYYVLTLLDYSMGEYLIILLLFYAYCYTKDRTSVNKWLYFVPMVLLVISSAVTFIDALNGGVFDVVDGICVETSGKPDICYLIEILATIHVPLITLIKRKSLGWNAIFLLGFWGVVPVTCVVLYNIYGGYDYSYMGCALVIVLMYLLLESRMAEEREHNQLLQIEESHALLEQLSLEQEVKISEVNELNKALIHNQKQLEEARNKAEDASAAKSRFLFNMSHDIRTPMNAIMGYAELIRQNAGNKLKVEDYIGKVAVSSRFLLSLINNVLEMSRIESGRVQLEEKPFAVKQFGQEVRDVYADSMRRKNIDFEVVSDVTVRYVYCDHTKVKQIFLNLVSNALKYTGNGGRVTVEVRQQPSSREGYVGFLVKISDNGQGISEEFLPKLFTEFEREKTYTDNKIEGTGLGLPIVKKLVELMGGSIEVESELGKGSIFTVKLEARIADDSEEQEEEVGNIATDEFAGKRILMAEDNAFNAEIAQEIISSMGIEVEVAEDGQVCVDKLANNEPGYYDMVLMDVQMPRMNGYEASRKIRAMADSEKAGIPIFALTANAFEEDRKNALDAGMNGHLAKPIETAVLLKTFRKVLTVMLFVLLPYTSVAQTTSEGETSIWEKIYMPIEMGVGFGANGREKNAYQVVTSLEYRLNREKGVFFLAEYDNHSHAYKDLEVDVTNVVEGDAQYTDILLGAGWRQPAFGPITLYSLAQMGTTSSTLKHMCLTDGSKYYLDNNDKTVTTFKLSVGVEYVFSPAYNLFVRGAYLHHLQPTQMEHGGAARGRVSITAGVNLSLF